MAQRVIGLRKNEDGNLVEVKLESGEIVSYVRVKEIAKNGEIVFENVFEGKDGDHFDHLPTF